MRIICYKSPQEYITHDFPKEELLEILETCKDLGIRWYVLVYEAGDSLKIQASTTDLTSDISVLEVKQQQ